MKGCISSQPQCLSMRPGNWCRITIRLKDFCVNAFYIRAHDDAIARVGESAKRPSVSEDRTSVIPCESSRSASRRANKSGTHSISGKQSMDSEALGGSFGTAEKVGKRGEAGGSSSTPQTTQQQESSDVPMGAGQAAAERGAGGSKSRGKGHME